MNTSFIRANCWHCPYLLVGLGGRVSKKSSTALVYVCTTYTTTLTYTISGNKCCCSADGALKRHTVRKRPHAPACTRSGTRPTPACGRTSGASATAGRRAAEGFRPSSRPPCSALRKLPCRRRRRGGSRIEFDRTRRARGTAWEVSTPKSWSTAKQS